MRQLASACPHPICNRRATPSSVITVARRSRCALTSTWPDGLLRDVGAEDDVVELLKIGNIEKEGQSRLGPLALVPSRVRCRDGKVREVKVVVQFRQTEQGMSCVIHGNYGYSVEK